jgi:predicted ribosomally synthesized peptide with nif11-like leader
MNLIFSKERNAMSLENARKLVTRLKDDRKFRDSIRKIDDPKAIWQTIAAEGFDCSPTEVQLVYNRYG